MTKALLLSFKINTITMINRSMKIKSLVWLWSLCTEWICKWLSMALRFRSHLRCIWMKKFKIIIIKFSKIIKILRAPWLVKKQPLIAPVSPWKIEVHICYKSNRPHFLSVYQHSTRLQMLGNTKSSVDYTASKLIERAINKDGKVPQKLRCCVGGRVQQGNLVLSARLMT